MEIGRKKVIMVDDDLTNLVVAKATLTRSYDILTAPSAQKLFGLLERITPDLILLDVGMPEMDGYEVIKILKSSKETSDIPIVFLTGRTDPKSEVQGLSLGAVDYISKPISPELFLKRVESHLLLEARRQEMKRYSMSLEGKVAEQLRAVFELKTVVLRTIADLVECRDSTTGGHIERTQNYLRQLVHLLLRHEIYAEELSSWDIDLLVMSSQLHDVGKISIRDSILLKPSELTAAEFEEMKKHAAIGGSIIEKIEKSTTENAFLEHAKIMAYSHHEKWDGSGYPLGLKGEAIPLQGRLMALIDVYDALTNDRPYKKAYTHEEAMDIIKKGLGTHFDPLLCKAFLENDHEFKRADAI
jgi:putative two-component system response regulator